VPHRLEELQEEPARELEEICAGISQQIDPQFVLSIHLVNDGVSQSIQIVLIARNPQIPQLNKTGKLSAFNLACNIAETRLDLKKTRYTCRRFLGVANTEVEVHNPKIVSVVCLK
jgi:hypothetical protein